jgi:Holliday junction resolvase RusA-like endonuclease
MRRGYLFRVNLRGFEPHAIRSGKGHKDVKGSLREAILKAKGASGISDAKKKIGGKTIRIEVEFRLWKGSTSTTNTRSRKDLDNLLKPVLDVLQASLDAQETRTGLDLIENDSLVHEIVAKKRIVGEELEEGIEIAISDIGNA